MGREKETQTSTSKWSLVVHRVGGDYVEVWVGTLYPTLRMPDQARVVLSVDGQTSQVETIRRHQWQRPFSAIKDQRFYYLCRFSGLQPSESYHLSFDRWCESEPDLEPGLESDPAAESASGQWQALRRGQFSTLPMMLPDEAGEAFTIGLGSCFYNHKDGGQAAEAYKALYEHGQAADRPDITLLTGDQVYLDIGFDSLSVIPSEIAQRIADDYACHWEAMGSILSRGATWMLPDDHEYWNDYPFYKSNIPTLVSLRLSKVRNAWTTSAWDAVSNIQRSPDVEHFEIGSDLSICLADLRSFRHENGFIDSDNFERLVEWAQNLSCPGVLAIPQPLIVDENNQEANLRAFDSQYQTLLKALAVSGHDILVLTGDKHFGRVAVAPMANGARLIEAISSPLSNLTGLNGIAVATPQKTPERFPPVEGIDNWPPVAVEYSDDYELQTRRGRLFSPYIKNRTAEHFMTVAFRKAQGQVQVDIKAWLVRDMRGRRTRLPRPGLGKTFSRTLR